MSAVGIFAQHEIGKRGHRKLAIIGQVVSSSLILGQDAYNYYVDKSKPQSPVALIGSRPRRSPQ